VTSSIKQQAAAPPASAAMPAQASVHSPTVAPAPTAPPAQASAPAASPASGPKSSATLPALAPPLAATPTPPASPRNQAQPEKSTPAPAAPAAGAIAAAPPAASIRVANVPEPAEPEGKSRIADYGLDVGGATTFDGLRALWSSLRSNTADLLDDLHPMIAVRESKSRGIDLRLVVGPIATSEAATQMCATLLAARRFCQMTVFEGQPLPQASAATDPRSLAAAPTRTPTAQSKAVRPPAPRP
jgi:hypothetical protein